ncbi:leucine-rich repeat flightless-interacting protein 2-like isoform X3 [Ptychodera flava]|uniref:leucine-rich repeat flightless-interacting protein 2-like isoform X3 n=1 Tax=Ptychodera flava TaxID=63121 RepID=UPI00396A8536
MSTPSSGRKRAGGRTYTAEGEALTNISREAEARLAARRAARAEARDIRMKELERQQKEAEKKMDQEFAMTNDEKTKNSKPLGNRTGMLTSSHSSLSSGSSRRGSEENLNSAFTEGSESLKDAFYELEDKYKKAMMTNAQLDNEKSAYIYQVDTLKDVLEEQEELMQELQREAREKHRDLEFKKRANSKLEYDITIYKEMIKQRDQLIEEHGLVLVGGEPTEEDEEALDLDEPVVQSAALVTPEAAQILEKAGDGSLDVRLKAFADEKEDLLEQIKKLKAELEEEKEKTAQADKLRASPLSPMNGPDLQFIELQRETSKQISDYKTKLQKSEQEKTVLEGNVIRLESQVKRYKTQAENIEKVESELKVERRKLQRELRIAQEKLADMELENTRLSKRIENMKSRSARNQALL